MIFVSYYFLRIMSSGLDDTTKHETVEQAIKEARSRVKAAGGVAHAVVTSHGSLVATIVQSKGRILTKKKR